MEGIGDLDARLCQLAERGRDVGDDQISGLQRSRCGRREARSELHREAADLAVRLAGEHVRATMTAADQSRLAGEYFKEMEAAR